MDKLDQIHQILKLLISPVTAKQSDLRHSLRENVRATVDTLNTPEMIWLRESTQNIKTEGPASDPCWDFTCTVLSILTCLCDMLVARSKSEVQPSPPRISSVDIIGARQQSDLRIALQLVTCLGIGRNLMPGVGVPLQRRTQFGHLLDEASCPSVKANSDYEKHSMLYTTVTCLHSCCRNVTMASLILTKHVDDLLAALCQLCYAPLKKSRRRAEGSKQSMPTDQSVVASIGEEERLLEEQLVQAEEHRKRCLVILPDVLGRTFRPVAIRELLMLQGTPKTSDSMVPAPNWLRKATQNLLNEIMISEHGLIAIIQGITDNRASELKSSEWQICNAIAKLIGNRLMSSSGDCQVNIASQILQLLHMKESSGNGNLPLIVSSVISLVNSVRPEIAKKFLLEPLFQPLISCAKEKAHSGDKEIKLTECLNSLHDIFVIGRSPNYDDILGHLTPMLGLLFHVHAFLLQTASSLRKPVEELLHTCLSHVETTTAVDQLTEVTFASADDDDSSMLTWNPCLEPHLDDEAGVSITQIDNSVRPTVSWLDTDLKIVSSVVSILSRLHNDAFLGKFFLRLLQNLSCILGTDSATPVSHPEDSRSDLIRLEARNDSQENHIRHSLLTLNLLSSLCEDPALQESIVKDSRQTLQFVNAMLERGAVLCSSQTEYLASMGPESLSMAMGILTLMLQKDDKDIQRMAMSCVPHLQTLKSRHSLKTVSEMAERLLTAIAMNDSVPMTKATQKQPKSDALSRFQQAWEDIFDAEVPIRGHAILVLKDLILSKDKETMNHCDELLVALRENLKHTDSYIYLMTVDGLAALASTLPDKVVPILTEEFGEQRFDAETRMKLGEVLVKVMRFLGAMVPKYRDRLLNAFLTTCRDEDPLVRSSSLSNLGEACKELRFALGSNVHEIFNCLSNFGKYDSNVQVRRAAVQVIVLLLRGLGKEALMALDYIVKDIYALLKFVYNTDKDDVVKLHAELGLDELQVICHEFLFPQMKLEKRIKVLEL